MNRKNALVLGASSDIGIALIRRIQANYDIIIAHYHSNCNELEVLRGEIGDKLQLIQADFSNAQEVDEFVETIKEKGIIINHIVHLPAQRVRPSRFTKTKWEDMVTSINVQIGSIYKISRALIPDMVKNNNGKFVVMISSCTVETPKFMLPYTTVKYALLGFVKALAAEYAEKGININAVSPSMIETKFLSDTPHLIIEQSAMENPMKRNASVDDVIPLMAFLLSEEASYITGQNIAISGGSVI